MKLPNLGNAEVEEARIVDYLLSHSHRDGRGKALFFNQFGFILDSWETLAVALQQHAAENDVTKTEETPFGTRYIVEGPIRAPDGRTPRPRVVWFEAPGEMHPRFVTAYPLPKAEGLL